MRGAVGFLRQPSTAFGVFEDFGGEKGGRSSRRRGTYTLDTLMSMGAIRIYRGGDIRRLFFQCWGCSSGTSLVGTTVIRDSLWARGIRAGWWHCDEEKLEMLFVRCDWCVKTRDDRKLGESIVATIPQLPGERAGGRGLRLPNRTPPGAGNAYDCTERRCASNRIVTRRARGTSEGMWTALKVV